MAPIKPVTVKRSHRHQTRSTTEVYSREVVEKKDKFHQVHDINSKIHKFILTGIAHGKNFEALKKILEQENNSLCAGRGINCFNLPMSLSTNDSQKQHWKSVHRLLTLDSDGVNACTEDGRSLLMQFLGNLEAVDYLLEHGANPNAEDDGGHTVLMRAIISKYTSIELVEKLIDSGANLFFPPSEARSSNNIFAYALEQYPQADETLCLPMGADRAIVVRYLLLNRPEAKTVELPEASIKSYKDIISTILESKLWDKSLTAFQSMLSSCLNLFTFEQFQQHEIPTCQVDFGQTNVDIEVVGLGKFICQERTLSNTQVMTNPMGWLIHKYFQDRINMWSKRMSSLAKQLNIVKGVTGFLNTADEMVLSPSLMLMIEFVRHRTSVSVEANSSMYYNYYSAKGGLLNTMDFMNGHMFLRGSQFPSYPEKLYHENSTLFFLNFLPVELVLAHIMMYMHAQDEEQELYKALLPYSPVHPCALAVIDNMLESKLESYNSLRHKSASLLKCLNDYVLQRCGKDIGGIANLRHSNEIFRIPGCFTNNPTSLKDMSRWALRMAIAEKRVTRSLSLPVYIRKLAEQNYLPKALCDYVLVFPPSKYLPF